MNEDGLTNSRRRFVLLLDPLPLRRAVLEGLLTPWAERCGTKLVSVSSPDALQNLTVASFRLILLVLGAQRLIGSEHEHWISSLRKRHQNAVIAILSERRDPEEIVAAFKAGARGYVPLNAEPSIAMNALTFVMNGGSYFPPAVLAGAEPAENPRAVIRTQLRFRDGKQLTARQHEVLGRLGRGESNRKIALQLGMEESTVKMHIRQIMRKLGATNRTQAALRAARLRDATGADTDDDP
jgi:DNA-binding NarL/FixJ family response regulator